jgi:tRNA U34 5-methylaminomethyl-2-thiouridine-forming methyltransferase MnmC
LTLFTSKTIEVEILRNLIEKSYWHDDGNFVKILFGDARSTIFEIFSDNKFDLIFLDAFSTNKNPELWTYDFLRRITKLLSNDGVLVTYSAAYPVRGALRRNKLFVGTTEPFGRIRGGTIASFQKQRIKTPLIEKEMNIILKSTAGVPYRDPDLASKASEIIKRREKTVHKLRKRGIPKWYGIN